MEEMIKWIIPIGATQQHVSLALIGSLLREMVNRNILTMDDAKAVIETARQRFDHGSFAEDEKLEEQVRLLATDGFDRALNWLTGETPPT